MDRDPILDRDTPFHLRSAEIRSIRWHDPLYTDLLSMGVPDQIVTLLARHKKRLETQFKRERLEHEDWKSELCGFQQQSGNQGMENEMRTLHQEIWFKNQEIHGLNMKLQGMEVMKGQQENINAVREVNDDKCKFYSDMTSAEQKLYEPRARCVNPKNEDKTTRSNSKKSLRFQELKQELKRERELNAQRHDEIEAKFMKLEMSQNEMRRLEQLKRDLENERIDIQDERDKLAVERKELDAVNLELWHRREEILRDEQRLKEESERLTGIALRHELNAPRNEVTADSFDDQQDEVQSDASDKNVQHQPASTYTGIIQCRDMSARDLPKADKLSQSDPYVVFTNKSGESAQTRKVNNNDKHPIWNEQLTLSANEHELISIRIYDWNKITADHLLCSMTVDIGSICEEGKEVLFQVAMDVDKQYEKQNKKPSFSCTLLYTKIKGLSD